MRLRKCHTQIVFDSLRRQSLSRLPSNRGKKQLCFLDYRCVAHRQLLTVVSATNTGLYHKVCKFSSILWLWWRIPDRRIFSFYLLGKSTDESSPPKLLQFVNNIHCDKFRATYIRIVGAIFDYQPIWQLAICQIWTDLRYILRTRKQHVWT